MLNLSEQRACLFEWHQENIGSSRQILVGTPSSVFTELRSLVVQYLDLILKEHWEEIESQGLDELFDGEVEKGVPQSAKRVGDVRPKIMREMGEKLSVLETGHSNQTVLGKWLDDIDWLCDTLPHGDGVFIPIEDGVQQFCKRLLDYETSRWESIKTSVGGSPPHDWIRKLAILSSCSKYEWDKEENISSFFSLVREFNEKNESL